ncbi:MAG: hypothetical protein ABUT20_22285 [Bacteroidota bacterium]
MIRSLDSQDRYRLIAADKLLWIVFIVYAFLSGFIILNHEMWGDEIHAWNIAKGSHSLADLFSNLRYEGHPPLWHIIIWTVSKFTHNLIFVQAVHWAIATTTVFLVLFFSPLPVSNRILIPFGYYFLFEYAVLSRNYAIGVLLAVCICLIIRKNFRYKTIVYYLILFLLSNTHLLGILLAGAIHVYYLLWCKEQNKSESFLFLHAIIGSLIAVPAIGFIFPPSDSELNVQYWLSRLDMRNFKTLSQASIRAFIPVPPWWIFSFWNFQFMLEIANKFRYFWIVNLLAAITIILLIVFILKGNKKSLILFSANILFSFIVAVTFFTLGAARYAGFLYIGFIVAYWLYCAETPVSKKSKYLVNGLLLLQLCGSIQPAIQDIRFPFSNAYRVTEIINEIPPGKRAVTDYWTLVTISAFADKPFYCIDVQKEISFILWNSEFKAIMDKKERFTEGVRNLMNKEGINSLQLISINPPDILSQIDPQLEKEFKVTLVDKREGAIERSGNLYLYLVDRN